MELRFKFDDGSTSWREPLSSGVRRGANADWGLAVPKTAAVATTCQALQAFGTPCYSISAKGAHAFQSLCCPIPELSVFFPALSRTLPNFDMSIMMSNAYPLTKSFVSFPPLVVTKNEHSTTIPNAE
jgi:hypothetical protein